MQKVNIGALIEKIGPINNQIRNSDGYRRIDLMWDVGDILVKAGIKKIHPIAWEIQSKSYITRDLLSYCYRIRKKWKTKEQLRKQFLNLKSYSAFREALPLIENEKFILSDSQVKQIINWLNNLDPKIAKQKILRLKKEHINIRNDRARRLAEVMDEGKVFSDFYNYITKLIADKNESELNNLKNKVGEEGLLKISQMCIAISNIDYKGPKGINTNNWPDKVKTFVDKLLPISQSKKEVKARFKRIISEENIVELADILNSLRSNESLEQIGKRLNIGIKLGK